MRFMLILATIVGLGASGAALAGEHGATSAMSVADMKAAIDKRGYDLRHLKSDDEYYKAYLIDRESGGAVEAAFDAETGELVAAGLARNGDEGAIRDRERAEDRRHSHRGEKADPHEDKSDMHRNEDKDDH